MPRHTYRPTLRRDVMAVVETQGNDSNEKKEERRVGEEFLYFIKGAALRASPTAPPKEARSSPLRASRRAATWAT
jgi:hypothetical protein